MRWYTHARIASISAVLLACVYALAFGPPVQVGNDRLFLKDGRVLEGEVVREYQGSVWFVSRVQGTEQRSFFTAAQIDHLEIEPTVAGQPDSAPLQPLGDNLAAQIQKEHWPTIPVPDLTTTELCAVVRVVDGDTLVVDRKGSEETVRLIGVDTPETQDPRKPVQFYGREAAAFLTNLLKGEQVYLAFERPGATDKYGRLLAHLYRAPDALWVNLELVRQGYAQVYTQEAFEQIDLFLTYQQMARETEKGLWDSTRKADWDRDHELAATPQRTPTPQTSQPAEETKPIPEKVTVYITRTGSKYHRAGCSYLRQSSIPIALSQAKGRYGACSRCNPPS